MISLRRTTTAAGLAWIAALLLTACSGGDEPAKSESPGAAAKSQLDAAMDKAYADIPEEARPKIERGEHGEIRYSGKTESGDSFEAQLGGDVTLPGDFPEDVPIYPGAVPFSVMETHSGIALVTVNSDDSESAIYEFYKEKLPAEGWQIDSEVNVGGGRIFQATKGDRRAIIHIQHLDDGTRVGFTVGPQS